MSAILILSLLIGTNLIYAQSFEFESMEETAEGAETESLISSHAEVKNISSETKNVKILVTKIDVVDGHDVSFCDLNSCYYLFDDSFETDMPFQLEAGGSTEEQFHIDLGPNGKTGTSVISARFFDADNPSDYIEYTCTFLVGPQSVNTIYSLNGGLSAPVPNPAFESAVFELPENLVSASEIRIHDLAGNLLLSKAISAGEHKTAINISALSQGTYYCSLLVGGNIIDTELLTIAR